MEYHTCIYNEILLYLLLWSNDFKCNLHLLRSKNIVNMNISALESCDFNKPLHHYWTITELSTSSLPLSYVLSSQFQSNSIEY